MARKRAVWERKRDRGRRRVARPLPKGGWTLVELAALAEISPRTITEYLGKGLLTSPEFRGVATRYQREHLLRLMAIREAKLGGERSLKAIKLKLETMGSREIELWLGARDLPNEAAAALELARPDPQAAAGSVAAPAPLTQTWKTLELMPGLELSLRADSGPVVQKVANYLYHHVARLIEQAVSSPPG